MRGDLRSSGRFAEAGDVVVRKPLSPQGRGSRTRTASGVVGAGDFLQVGACQLAVDAVDQRAHFPGVNEERLFAAVAKTPFGVGSPVFGEKPEADRNLQL